MPQMRQVAEEITRKNKDSLVAYNLFRYSRGRKGYVTTLYYNQIPEGTEVFHLGGRISFIEVKRKKPRYEDNDFDHDEEY